MALTIQEMNKYCSMSTREEGREGERERERKGERKGGGGEREEGRRESGGRKEIKGGIDGGWGISQSP